MTPHVLYVTGVVRPIAACSCGWVSEERRSRGEAYRAWRTHRWLAARRHLYGPKSLSAGSERDR